MVRKRRPQIEGKDPEYTSDFNTKLPTSMPQQPKPAKVQRTPDAAERQIELTAPTVTRPAKIQKPKPQRLKPSLNPIEEGAKRLVALTSAITVEHHAKLRALSLKGIAPKDAMSLAGRRAVDLFKPQEKYIEKPKGNRMPMRQGYKTTKAVEAKLVDALREKHDPLKLLSDGAMLRGQFEPLFWNCMDEIITELNKKFG